MLVLTRRAGESIVIGNEIVVTVVEVRSGQVRLGIQAPRHIEVHRHEIYEQVRDANLRAARDARGTAEAVKSRYRR